MDEIICYSISQFFSITVQMKSAFKIAGLDLINTRKSKLLAAVGFYMSTKCAIRSPDACCNSVVRSPAAGKEANRIKSKEEGNIISCNERSLSLRREKILFLNCGCVCE